MLSNNLWKCVRAMLAVALVGTTALAGMFERFAFTADKTGVTASTAASSDSFKQQETDEAARAAVAEDFAQLPLRFETNAGQTDRKVKFISRGSGYVLFLTPTEAVMSLSSPVGAHRKKTTDDAVADDKSRRAAAQKTERTNIRMRLIGANQSPRMEALEELPGKSNYFTGENPAAWRTNVASYARVRYSEVYPGIDLIYYGKQRELEYDFRLAAGADPDQIEIAFKGAEVELTEDGDLLLHAHNGDVRQRAPIAYQEIDGERVIVESRYVMRGGDRVGFALGAYDATLPVVIDPVLVYSTYLGGNGFDQGFAVAVDAAGSAYIAGHSAALDFPTTAGAYQPGPSGSFVTKLNPAGSALVYSTYLAGGGGNAIAVDASGNAYVAGDASTLDFPVTPGAFTTQPSGYDVSITKLNATGSALLYSARFGGLDDDFARGVAVDAAGNAYLTGWTTCRSTTCTFPVANAFQPAYGGGNNDAFVTKINATGSALVYSTFLGGGQMLNATDDWGQAIAVDAAGSAYVTGYTVSPDFPVKSGAFDTSREGFDAFVTKFTPEGTSLVYSTFLGGFQREQGQSIAVDQSGNAYVVGLTESTNFPVTSSALKRTGDFDAFVTKLNANGSGLVYSTYLGGSEGVDRAWGVAVDAAGSAYVVGDTTSNTFPVTDAAQAAYGGGLSDAFIAKLNATGSGFVYSTFLGGSLSDQGRGLAVDAEGNAYATGFTSSYNFPTSTPFQGANGGGVENHDDAFVVKLGTVSTTPTPTPTPTPAPEQAPTPEPTPVPAPTPAASLSSVSLNPSSVTGGGSVQGTVTLTAAAPSGGATVTLASSNSSIVRVPASVTVAAGATSATFNVTTVSVSSTTSAQVSASYGGTTSATSLTVTPPAAPAPSSDVVGISQAEYSTSKRQLKVTASSSRSGATLRVYVTSTGALIGTLKAGGTKHSGQFSLSSNPQSITVKSSLGGAATRSVTTTR
ncbi:MAG TPA: SBBP repeat-containing protein [Pyrinomonadaceae bacterium]|nr:SBBP repeat-containing protein [Pyrinomonadaceae bacterium]